jgi:hypothetical protein
MSHFDACRLGILGHMWIMESCQNINSDTRRVASRSPTLRSKLSNGSKLLPMTDGRSATARRFKDLVEDIAADLGGKAMLSEGQRPRGYALG